MRDYKKSKIYKIIDNTTDLVYIGSTTEPTLAQRLAHHVSDFKKWKNGKHSFISSFPIIENGDYRIILLESCPCENIEELLKKEQEYIDKIKCCNKNNAVTNQTEYNKKYYDDNKETLKEYQKHYRETNKELINQKHTCPCGGHFTTSHKERHMKSKKHLSFVQNTEIKI